MELVYEDGNELRVVFFDATITELHNAASTPTEHPIEGGSSLTDHIQIERARLSVEVRVTNTPIRSPGVDGAFGDVRELATGRDDVKASTLQFVTQFDRVATVYEQLQHIRAKRLTVIASTSLAQYDRMVIADISAPRNVENRHAVTFTLEMVEVSFAESETVDAPEPAEVRGQRRRNRGAQTTEDAAAPPTQTNSVARRILSPFYE